MIDNFKRYQVGLRLIDLFPNRIDGLCACGCGKILNGRKKRWASECCQSEALNIFLIVKGDSFTIRSEVFERDNGFCCKCGVLSLNWHADHITPVFLGGSACGLDNFQTLCIDCHKGKSYIESQRPTISSHASSMFDNRRLTDFGASS
jgi:hypothetical protein